MASVRKKGFRARANNEKLSPPEIVANIRKLLGEYGEMPLQVIPTLYKAKFGDILCCVSRGYAQGLPGFLRSLGSMIEFRHDIKSGLCFVSLAQKDSITNFRSNKTKENCPPLVNDDIHPERRKNIEALFDPNSFLWNNKRCLLLLSKRDISIEKSGLELARERYGKHVDKEVNRIRRYLSQHPRGIKLSDIDLRINMKTFNVATSLNGLTLELPEIFFRQESKTTGGEAIVSDGHAHTIDLVTELRRIDCETTDRKLISDAINLGIYQKTLLLIPKTGLKLNVWLSSMVKNFRTDEEAVTKYLNELDVIQYFTALARQSLIELRSSDQSQNDLRAFLPSKPVNFLDLKQKLARLIDFDEVSSSTGSDPDKVQGRRARVLASLMKMNTNGNQSQPNQTKPN